MKKALITGITGQDGAYLTELLLSKGYEVHGIKRRASLFNTDRIDHLYQDPHEKNIKLKLHYGDLTDSTNLIRIIQEVQPDEIYNLGAMSHVKVSFDTPEYTANVDGLGTLRLLEAIRILRLEKKLVSIKLLLLSFMDLYKKLHKKKQLRSTLALHMQQLRFMATGSLLTTVKLMALYACNGILFNHESPLRGETFVTRKITRSASKIAYGLEEKLFLGNLNAKRDWGHAQDYVEAMWLMLQQDKAEDFVIATGVTTTVRDFVKLAFAEAGIEVEFKGEGVEEKGYVKACTGEFKLPVGKEIVAVDAKYFRPTEVDLLLGDPTKANTKLKWKPKHNLQSLVKDMMKADLALFKRDKYLLEGGHKIFNYHE